MKYIIKLKCSVYLKTNNMYICLAFNYSINNYKTESFLKKIYSFGLVKEYFDGYHYYKPQCEHYCFKSKNINKIIKFHKFQIFS